MGSSELADWQRRRLEVVRHYDVYVRALRSAHLDPEAGDVRACRRALARAIEEACTGDPYLLQDFKRAFAAQPRRDA
jgi:hypothetical protein